MNSIFNITNILINQNIGNKQEAFKFVMEMFLNNKAVELGYLESMIKRDLDSSVALGNFLALPHGIDQSDHLIKKDCVIMIHLAKPFFWDNQEIRFIFALALKNKSQMEFIQKVGIAFSDKEEVKHFIEKQDLSKQDLFNWIESQ